MNKKTELLLGGLILGASYVQAIDNSSIDRIKVREMMTHLYESFGSIPGIIPPKHEVDKTPVNFGEARNSLFPYALQRVEDIEARLDYDEDEEEAEEDAEFMAFLSLMGISDEGDDLQHRAADSRRHHASNIKQPIVAYGVTTSAPQSVSALTEELLETLSKEEKRDEPANELIIEVMNQLLICTSEQIITNLIDEIIQKNGWRAIARLSDENIEANSALKNVLNAPYNHAKYHSVFAFPVI
ncbi:MAG: hypothetical protein LBJ71_03895, partial [Holosporaceae bacterium]|nr:hypothetical protein [Holosporaceae bacterium]